MPTRIHPFFFALFVLSAVAVAQPPTKPIGEGVTAGDSSSQRPQTKRAVLELANGSTEVVTYVAMPDGTAVIDGDIVITVDENGRARIAKEMDRLWNERGLLGKSTGLSGTSFRWQNNTVPYLIQIGEAHRRLQIEAAMDHIESRTAVRFIPRTNQTDYVAFINFLNPGVCRSSVGRQGGRQEIYLHSTCSTGTVIHEIGHALGLWHEQQRTDRDNYVIVNWDNIQRVPFDARSNFETRSGFRNGPFDFGSIMNYGSFFFAIDPSVPTLTRLDGSTWVPNRNVLSSGDVAGIGVMHKPIRVSIGSECFPIWNTCDFVGSPSHGVLPVTSWRWTIDDGSRSVVKTGNPVSHQVQGGGEYFVTVEAFDSQGDRAVASRVVVVDTGCGNRVC